MALTLDDVKFASRMNESRVRSALELAEKLSTDPQRARRLQRQECVPCFYTQRMAGQAFTGYTCALCASEQQYHNTAVPKLCPTCATANGLCVRCGADMEGLAASAARKAPLVPAEATPTEPKA